MQRVAQPYHKLLVFEPVVRVTFIYGLENKSLSPTILSYIYNILK